MSSKLRKCHSFLEGCKSITELEAQQNAPIFGSSKVERECCITDTFQFYKTNKQKELTVKLSFWFTVYLLSFPSL